MAAFLHLALLLLAQLPFASDSWSARASLIRDTEIENIIRAYAQPIFKAAGLKSNDVKIFIVNDNSLNAFVAGGQNLFINTGLILRSDSANQIIGVIAHETGHIAGGHLSRVHDALSKASASAIVAMILGAAAGVASDNPDLGVAIIGGGQGLAVRNFLAYSRVQEGSADHAAISYLEQTQQSTRGLLQFMEKLGDQELLSIAQQDPYVRSHPLTRDRISTLREHVDNSKFSATPETSEFQRAHRMMRAKLFAFVNPYGRTIRAYRTTDSSPASRYARAIGEYRRGKLDPALDLINGLIHESPGSPYFHELKGQMLFEHGRIKAAMQSYGRAAELLPDAPLIRRDLARSQLEAGDPALLKEAIDHLQVALAADRDSALNWRLLATAHGKRGDHARGALALAEEALILGRPDVARFHAGKALKAFSRGSREWLQAEDIHFAADELERTIKRRRKQ